jgi:hypothetical protein
MSFQHAARTLGLSRGVLLALVSMLALACTSTGATTAPVASPSPSVGLGTIASPVPSAAPSTQASTVPASVQPSEAGSPSGEPQLLANLCDMLDTATIDSITGLQVPPGEKLNGSSGTGLEATGHCLWGKPSDGIGVEISAFKEAPIQAFLGASLPPGMQAGMQAVSGIGVSAKGSTTTIGGIIHASLYVDFGTFGMLVVTDTANATLDMSVALAKALK